MAAPVRSPAPSASGRLPAIAARGAPWVLTAGALAAAGLGLRALHLLWTVRSYGLGPGEAGDVILVALAGFGLAGGLSWALRGATSTRVNLALALVSSGLALYAVEWLLPDAVTRSERRRTQQQDLIASLRRSERRVHPLPRLLTTRLRLDGVDVVPLAGVGRSTVVACSEADGWLVYSADRHGFPNPDDVWDGRPADLAIVGDSFAASNCVPPADSIASHMRRSYPRVVTLAMPGIGPLLELAALREYGPLARPRRVLWLYYANDLRDLGAEWADPLLRRYQQPDFEQGLARRQPAIDLALGRVLDAALTAPPPSAVGRGLLDTLLLRNLRLRSGLSFPSPSDLVQQPSQFERLRQVLSLARSQVGSWGGELTFVYLPQQLELRPARQVGGAIAHRLVLNTRARVLSVARRLGLPLLDLSDAFASRPVDELFACSSCHYSREGYRLVAEQARRFLASRDAIAAPAEAAP